MDDSHQKNATSDGKFFKSIRRQSFIESYGILEEEAGADAGLISSIAIAGEGISNSNSSDIVDRLDSSGRKSMTIDDLEEVDIEFPQFKDGNDSMDLSLLDSFSSSMKIEERQGNASPPKNFAGGKTRRKGDPQRRMRQRCGMPPETRRASTGTFPASSMNDSFGESLASFTSINSFTSTNTNAGGEPNKTMAVGNLVFVTDAEMEKIMYGDDEDNKTNPRKATFADSRRRTSSSISNVSASLPPSATLGTGAFSTVRLAWRKTTDDEHEREHEQKRSSFQAIGEKEEERDSRRNIIHVTSKDSNEKQNNNSIEEKGELVAVKIMQKSILKKMKTIQKGNNNRVTVITAFDNIEREIATMKRLHHPNLVRLFEVIDSVESDRLHMVLEYVSLGEILSHVEGTNQYKRMRYRKKVKGLTERGYFDEKHAALYFVDIMHGLAYLHRNRICHRDLKPENILLSESGIVKISDFGVAHIFEDEKQRESYLLDALDDDSFEDLLSDSADNDFSMKIDNETDTPSHLSQRESDAALTMSSKFNRGTLTKTEGTWCFWSPEMCTTESSGFSGYASDLWAAGVCLYIFTTGRLPFFSMLPTVIFELIAKDNLNYEGLGLSDELVDLLKKLLDKNPATRAGVGDCLKHEFCANARIERTNELGSRFNESEDHIILSKNDVDMALSVTATSTLALFRRLSKRRSAPASSFISNAAAVPASARKLNNNEPHLTTLGEAKGTKHPMKKGVSIASKFKNKLFGRD